MELRQSDRVRRFLSVGFALLVGMAMAALYLRISDTRGAPSCVRGYAEAQTAADTALVDVQPTGAAAVGRLDAAYNATCGQLRLRGPLR